jgi:hypothetical protein
VQELTTGSKHGEIVIVSLPRPSKMNLGANIFQTIRWRLRTAAAIMLHASLTPCTPQAGIYQQYRTKQQKYVRYHTGDLNFFYIVYRPGEEGGEYPIRCVQDPDPANA